MKTKALQAVLATAVVAAIALVAVWTAQPLLAPSLASAAYAQILTPNTSSATTWSTLAGQIAGLVGGFGGVLLAGAFAAPVFTGGHPLVYDRVLAISIAVALATALQLLVKATSPAGGATALVVALGVETPTWDGAARLLAGIALVTLLGEAARRAVLRAQ